MPFRQLRASSHAAERSALLNDTGRCCHKVHRYDEHDRDRREGQENRQENPQGGGLTLARRPMNSASARKMSTTKRIAMPKRGKKRRRPTFTDAPRLTGRLRMS